MRISLLLVAAVVLGVSACNTGQSAPDTPGDSVLESTVDCADAQILAARSLDPPRRKEGDRAKIIRLNRAVYFAALANVAELKCKVTDLQADGTLTRAFDAAHKAEATASEYEKAQLWSQAALYATQAGGQLMRAAVR